MSRFLSSDVPRDVRLPAAAGLAIAEGRDRLALLALLTGDPGIGVAWRAKATIAAIPVDRDVPASVRLAAAQAVERTAVAQALRR